MGLIQFSSPATTDVPVVTTAETVIAGPVFASNYGPGNRVTIKGWVQFTPGTATTGLTFRVRKSIDATGTVVGEGNLEIVEGAAGSTEDHTFETEDRPSGEIVSQPYVLTVTQTAATANGTAVQGRLEATVGV